VAFLAARARPQPPGFAAAFEPPGTD